jgi:hypothetical protein
MCPKREPMPRQSISDWSPNLSGATAIRVTRTAILGAADVALARNDIATLEKLLRETKILVASLQRGDQPAPGTEEPVTTSREVGPGLPGWGQPRRSVAAPWRRPQAPIQYPYGDPPSGWDTHLDDTTISMPESKCSSEDLRRLHSWRRTGAEHAAAAAEAEQRWWQHHVTDDS